MSVGQYDVEINGVGYHLAEDAEGQHYSLTAEPLRPPNAVTVQGESSQRFQMRPDTLLWSITDWSGGEGQIKYDQKNPTRHRELTGVRVFERPGTLQPGYYLEETQDNTGAADLADSSRLFVFGTDVKALSIVTNPYYYSWSYSAEKWGAAVDLSTGSVTVGARTRGKVAADETYFYWMEHGTNDIHYSQGTALSTLLFNGTDLNNEDHELDQIGGYVYATDVIGGEVWEISKQTGTGTLIDDFSDEAGGQGNTWTVVADGKLYVAIRFGGYTTVREITPTSAAGTGYGAEIARLPGFEVRAIWQHSGILYMAGELGYETSRDAIMYIVPGQSYGTLGEIRPDDDIGVVIGPQGGSGLLEHYFAVQQLSTGDQKHGIFQIDSVSGGFACIAYNEDGDGPTDSAESLAVARGNVFLSTQNGATSERIFRASPDYYTKSSWAISPWNDFALADEKILSSLVLSTEDLPADWTVYVDYAIDGGTTWTNAITYSTTSGNGTKQPVSTDTSTIKFHTLSIRIRMVYTGMGVPTSGPVVLGVDALAMVAKPTKVWRLILDLGDDKSRKGGSSGQKKRENLMAASATEGVVALKDGYGSRTPGVFDEYDVVVDSFNMVLTQPGEGLAQVTLKETA